MQHTSLGQAEVTAYLKVDKVNGETKFYKVVSQENTEISEEDYQLNNK